MCFVIYRGLRENSDHSKRALLDFSLTVKTATHECVIKTSQP